MTNHLFKGYIASGSLCLAGLINFGVTQSGWGATLAAVGTLIFVGLSILESEQTDAHMSLLGRLDSLDNIQIDQEKLMREIQQELTGQAKKVADITSRQTLQGLR